MALRFVIASSAIEPYQKGVVQVEAFGANQARRSNIVLDFSFWEKENTLRTNIPGLRLDYQVQIHLIIKYSLVNPLSSMDNVDGVHELFRNLEPNPQAQPFWVVPGGILYELSEAYGHSSAGDCAWC